MEKKRKFKYAIFDKDGVLTDSMGQNYKVFDAAAREFLGQVFTKSDFFRRFIGVPWREILKPYFKNDEQYQKFADAFHERLVPAIKYAPLFPLVKEVLDYLKNDAGFDLFVSSSAPQPAMDDFLAREGLGKYFKLGRGRGERHVNKREHMREFAQVSGLSMDDFAAEAFIIEDMVHGIEAAKAFGLFAIGLETSLTAPELKAAGADVVLPNHAALLEYLKENL